MRQPGFIHQTRQFLLSNKLLGKGDKIIVSVSGGVDSVALLHFFYSIKDEFDLRLAVAHFDHQMRPASKEDHLFVEGLAQKLKVDYHYFKNPRKFSKVGFQAAAGLWRKTTLHELLERLKYDKIGLGHHLDDLAETVLWKILRGTSIIGLNPLKARSKNIIRPFLCQYKSAIVEFMQEQKLNWREDLSNYEDLYTRNLIRNSILPKLEEVGKVRLSLIDLAREAAEFNEFFEEQTAGLDLESSVLTVENLLELPSLFAKEALGRFLTNQGLNTNRQQLNRIYSWLTRSKKSSGKIDLGAGYVLRLNKTWLTIEKGD